MRNNFAGIEVNDDAYMIGFIIPAKAGNIADPNLIRSICIKLPVKDISFLFLPELLLIFFLSYIPDTVKTHFAH
jgi:hypothetical protein